MSSVNEAGLDVVLLKVRDSAGHVVDLPVTGGKLQVDADIVVGDTIELTNTTLLKALASRLAKGDSSAFINPATDESTLLVKVAVENTGTLLTRSRSSLNNPTDYRDPTDPVNTADANAGVFPGALAGDQLKVVLLPAGYHHHDVSLCWPGNAVVNAEAVYDVYAIHSFALMSAFTVGDYRDWPKIVDNLTKSRAVATDNAQAVVPGDFAAVAVVIRSVAVAPTAGTARVIVHSR
jgi:hypothetical protein